MSSANFDPGKYKTRAGLNAVVAKLKVAQGEWFLQGAIEDPSSLALVLAKWDVRGRAIWPVNSEKHDLLAKESEPCTAQTTS